MPDQPYEKMSSTQLQNYIHLQNVEVFLPIITEFLLAHAKNIPFTTIPPAPEQLFSPIRTHSPQKV